MSKQITAQLLKKKVDSIKNPGDGKRYLIECLKKQGFITIEPEVSTPTKPISHDTCKLCHSSDFIYTSHEQICKTCGISEQSFQANPFKTYKQDINFSKGSFIEPGTLTVKVIKDGKQVSRDLSQINTWLSSDPEEQRIKTNMIRINETLDLLASNYNPIIFDKVKSQILSMWYNVITIKPNIRGKEKQALEVWSIYYPMVYNRLSINIQKLVSIYYVQIGEVYSYNFVMRDIFSGTSFEPYISVPIGSVVDILLTPDINIKIKRVKNDLKDYLGNPLKDKELYGIIYYLGKITGDKTYTLTYLFEKTNISPNVISAEAAKIEKFYNGNPGMMRKLLIKHKPG